MAKIKAELRPMSAREQGVLRFSAFLILALFATAGAEGCATRNPASQIAEQASAESDDDSSCQRKGAPASQAYEACRQQLAEARAKAAAMKEERRRDFDRTLGAGTDAQTNF
jgi:hypothetical protein